MASRGNGFSVARFARRLTTPPMLLAAIPWSLSALVAAYLFVLVTRLGIRIPIIDEWLSLGNTLLTLERGEGFWTMLWAQHNEHRIPIARLVDIAVVFLGGGNLFIELYVNLALAIATALILGIVVQRELQATHPRLAPWMALAMTLLVLSPSQMEIWLFPQIPYTAQTLFIVLGLLALSGRAWSWWRLGLAALCGALATASLSSGLLFWPAALVPLAGRAGPRAKWVLPGWIVLSAAVWWIYFSGFHRPAAHPSLSAWLADPGALVQFFLAVLGNPMAAVVVPQSALAAILVPAVGAVGAALLVIALVRLYRSGTRPASVWFWLGLAVYAAMCAGIITLGRLGFGLFLALSSRYITLTWPFWAAAVMLPFLAFLAEPAGFRVGSLPLAARIHWVLSACVLAACIVVSAASINTFVRRWTPIATDRQAAMLELPDLCQGNVDLVRHLGPIEITARYLPVMVRHGVIAFPQEPFSAAAADARSAPPGAIESVRLEAQPVVPGSGRCLRIAGWAGMERAGTPAREVVLAASGTVLKRAWVGQRRAHAGADYDADPHPAVGWVLYLDTTRLKPADDRLELYALLPGAVRPAWIGSILLKDVPGLGAAPP